MPSNRFTAGPVLPRWIRDPGAADFASPERLIREAQAGGGLTGWLKPMHRFRQALDLMYGADQAASGLVKPPPWPGGWAPWRGRYDPAAYKVLPDGPPAWLAEAVRTWQDMQDAELRRAVIANTFPEYRTAALERLGLEPS